jgi:hypothetical protein
MQQPSRRTVVRAAVVAAGAFALRGSGSAEALTPRAAPTRLRRGVFRPHVGTSFVLRAGRTTQRAVLVGIEDHPRQLGHDSRFSLEFRVVGRGRPAEGVYTVSHPKLRAFDLYVVPVGAPAAGALEAVVNV